MDQQLPKFQALDAVFRVRVSPKLQTRFEQAFSTLKRYASARR